MNKGIIFAALAFQGILLGADSVEGSKVYAAPAWEFTHSHWGGGKKQNGSLWGGVIGYQYEKRDGLYCNLDFTAMAGKWHGTAGNNPTQEYITELRLGYVGTPAATKAFTLTPFIGVGSYVFNQTISGPNFNSYFWYVPIGVRFEYRINKSLSIGFLGMGAPTFSGSYKVTHRRHAPTAPLWKAELPITYLGSLPFSFSFIPFFKDWAYLQHKELIKQRNIYYGLNLVFGYRF
jgi:hypothetical protein